MPTVGTKLSLEETQAVGAILLREFARERFDRAGLDGNLIREAEETMNLDDINITLNSGDFNTSNVNSTMINSPNITGSNNNESMQDATLTEQYHSLTENIANSSNNADRTLYHSLMNASQNSSSANHDGTPSYTSVLASYGRELRRIAEEFEKSPLRQSVRERANNVNLLDVTKDGFIQLLEELFQGKITREKIIILFFFCTDVALRASEFAKELVVKLMGWSFTYIINTVCSVVYKMGGWDRLLTYQLPSILISCGTALLICSLFIFVRKSFRNT